MDEEDILEAKALYDAHLASVEDALRADASNAELLQVRADLQAALQEIDEVVKEESCIDKYDNKNEEAQSVEEVLPRLARPRPPPPPQGNTARNGRIHPRNVYATEEPDFAALAVRYPSLEPFLLPPKSGKLPGSRRALDFSSPAACRELTRVLLHADFGIKWWVPDGQLVPPLTNRLNYIHWLDDLIRLSSPRSIATDFSPVKVMDHKATTPPAASPLSRIRGLDIGCGANLIYPLLGAAVYGWSFVGVDVTPVALEWARRNLESNPQFRALIHVRGAGAGMQPRQAQFFHNSDGSPSLSPPKTAAAVVPAAVPSNGGVAELKLMERMMDHAAGAPSPFCGEGILAGAVRKGETFAFCMSNPPFFESIEEAGANPATSFGGSAEEMVYPGGELAFVRGMIEDSVELQGQIHWYTTMVGKKGTLKAVRSVLGRTRGVQAIRTTEFSQGKTSRWGIAWSFVADSETANRPLQRLPEVELRPAMKQRQWKEEIAITTTLNKKKNVAAVTARPTTRHPPGVGLLRKRLLGGSRRSVSLQVHVPSAAEATKIVESVREFLESVGMECRLKAGGFTVAAEPQVTNLVERDIEEERCLEGGLVGEQVLSRKRVRKSDQELHVGNNEKKSSVQSLSAAAVPLQAQLLMQHASLFVLTLAVDKSVTLVEPEVLWFGRLVEAIEQRLAESWEVT